MRGAILLLSIAGCGAHEATLAYPALDRVEFVVRRLPVHETPAPVHEESDPYAEWPSWCESPERVPCETARDCSLVPHPAGKEMKCVRPWYAKGEDYRVCSPGYADREERDHQRARLYAMVVAQYVGTGVARAERLAKFLQLVAMRETTLRPWKRHRLSGDVRANRSSWARMEARYAENEHYEARWRWEYGLGLYGMNAALNTATWDSEAPPEVLCRDVEATEVYLRVARREWHGTGGHPTWHDVHRAASSGKLCPGEDRGGFDRRAERVGFDPYRRVRLRDLGKPIPREGQNEEAEEIRLLVSMLVDEDW